MPKGRREVIDISTPAVVMAEGGEEADPGLGDDGREARSGYNPRRGPPPEEPDRWGAGQMDLEEDEESDADAAEEFRGPGR